MRIALEFDISEAEAIAALKFNQARLLRKARRVWVSGAFLVLSLAVWGAFGYLAADSLFSVDSSTAQAIVGLFVLAAVLMSASQLQVHAALFAYLAGKDGALRGTRTLSLDDGGVRVVGAHAQSFFPWQGIRSVEGFAGQTVLYVDQASFIQIPHRVFADEAERTFCLDWIAARIAQEGVAEFALPTLATPAASAAEIPVVDPIKDLLATLRLGAQGALFLKPDATALPATWSQLAALLVLGLSLPLGADLISVGWNGSFSPYGLPGALFPLPILMLAAWALARLAEKADRTLDLLVVFFSLSLPIDLASILFGRLMESGLLPNVPGQLRYLAYYAPTLWLVLATTLVAIRVLDLPAHRWLAAGLAASVLLGAPLSLVYRERTLWQPAVDPEAQAEQRNRYHALTSEDAFYLQPKLLERQLAALQPGRKGRVDLYFVGAAGDAGQDVFMKEVQSVAGLFEERFGTAGRSLMLINNARTVADSPIASNTSLRLAFKRVGEVMDSDEDILFLFLTSHGSQDHRFSLSFSPMQFNPLDPRRLREMLDDAGIKRRVIVVSSCYSGGYVEALENENSLVITAAASDKASFGCSNEAEFTYFGKAYFDEALRQTYSFIGAFELAKPRIAEREREQDYEPSGARMSVGAAIRPVLESFAAARSAAPVPDQRDMERARAAKAPSP